MRAVLFVIIVIVRRDAGRLAASRRHGGELLCELSIVRRRGILIIRRWRLGRHETNRCCTAGLTAIEPGSGERYPLRILSDRDEFSKTFGAAGAVRTGRASLQPAGAQSSDSTLSKNE